MSRKHDCRNWDLVHEWNSLKPFVKIRRFMVEVRASHPFAVAQYETTIQRGADEDVAQVEDESTMPLKYPAT